MESDKRVTKQEAVVKYYEALAPALGQPMYVQLAFAFHEAEPLLRSTGWRLVDLYEDLQQYTWAMHYAQAVE